MWEGTFKLLENTRIIRNKNYGDIKIVWGCIKGKRLGCGWK